MALVLTPGIWNCASAMSQSLAAFTLILWRGDGAPSQIRRRTWGGSGEAVGIKGDYLPDVVDATAGLGAMPLCWLRSAAACGCWSVIGGCCIARRRPGAWLCGCGNRGWLQERLQLIHASSLTALTVLLRARRWSISIRCSRISRKRAGEKRDARVSVAGGAGS